LFSAFYSPLISLMSGDILQVEGLEADWSVSPPGVSAVKALEEGRPDVIQSAPSQAFTTLAKGETPTAIHFAQINEMDGSFITGRVPDPDFDWKRLEGSEVILFGGGQPLAMFNYACHKAGIDFAKLKVIGLGSAEEMDKAFREGKGHDRA
jgi:NitT/TauT family transport system substrate-binding protein